MPRCETPWYTHSHDRNTHGSFASTLRGTVAALVGAIRDTARQKCMRP